MSLLLPFILNDKADNFCENILEDLLEVPRKRYSPYLILRNRKQHSQEENIQNRNCRKVKKPCKDNFKINLDVRDFAPEEITVKAVGENTVCVEAKHEDREHKGQDDTFVSRHFVNKYTLPEGYDIDNVKTCLSADGVLAITAPKLPEKEVQYREIPIIRVDASSTDQEKAKEKNNKDTNEEKPTEE